MSYEYLNEMLKTARKKRDMNPGQRTSGAIGALYGGHKGSQLGSKLYLTKTKSGKRYMEGLKAVQDKLIKEKGKYVPTKVLVALSSKHPGASRYFKKMVAATGAGGLAGMIGGGVLASSIHKKLFGEKKK